MGEEAQGDEKKGFTIHDGVFLDELKRVWGDDYGKYRQLILENDDKSSPVAEMMRNEPPGRY